MRKKFDFYDMQYMLITSVISEIAICLELAELEKIELLETTVTVTITSDDLYDTDIKSIQRTEEGIVFQDVEDRTFDAFDMTFTSLVDLYNEVYSICKGVVDRRIDEKNCNQNYS